MGRLPLHIAGHMGIGIEGERRLRMTQDSREGLGIHAAGQSVGGKRVTEICLCQAQTNKKLVQNIKK